MPLAIAVGGASGGGEAQPPVAFRMGTTGAVTQSLVSATPTKIVCPSVTLDTDNLINDSTITIKKEGIYQFNATFTSATGDPSSVVAFININGDNLAGGSHNPTGTPQYASTVSNIFELKVGDKVELWGQVSGTDLTAYKSDKFASLSGHMISSITEGEVKEKEAVVLDATLSAYKL